jgi:hypothetical protein
MTTRFVTEQATDRIDILALARLRSTIRDRHAGKRWYR